MTSRVSQERPVDVRRSPARSGSRQRLRLAVALLLAAALAAAFAAFRRTVPRAAGPLPHETYVWQRDWSPAVKAAVDRASSAEAGLRLGGLVVLAAEVSWRGGKPQTVRVAVDHDLLRRQPSPVGLALRVGPHAGRMGEADVTRLCELASSLVGEAREAGWSPAELQIDFDSAESKLGDYAAWAAAVRRRVAPLPVTITALPSWLGRGEFVDLARAAGGYVLQVHSFERPAGPDAGLTLCDPAAARRAVERAARIGVPFRVALPTYGYVVAFDRSGKFIGLSAEGPTPAWPADAVLREVRADPQVMADLVARWTADRPAALRGVIWYRLPTDGDALNWRWPTLAAVAQGRRPQSGLRAASRTPEAGLIEVDLVNDGDADADPNVAVRVGWRGADLVAADGLGGFHPADPAAGSVDAAAREITLQPVPGRPVPRLRPGERKAVGWIRLTRPADTEVRIDVLPAQPKTDR